MISFDLISKSLHEQNLAKKSSKCYGSALSVQYNFNLTRKKSCEKKSSKRNGSALFVLYNFNLTKKYLVKKKSSKHNGFTLFGLIQLQFDEKNLAEKNMFFFFWRENCYYFDFRAFCCHYYKSTFFGDFQTITDVLISSPLTFTSCPIFYLLFNLHDKSLTKWKLKQS